MVFRRSPGLITPRIHIIFKDFLSCQTCTMSLFNESNHHSISDSGSDGENTNESSTKKIKLTEKPPAVKPAKKQATLTSHFQVLSKTSGSQVKPSVKSKPDTSVNQLPMPDLSYFSSNSKNTEGDSWNFKISTWNVAGLRACVKKGGMDYIKLEDPDIICLQETKCPENKLPSEVLIPGYYKYWVNGVKDGYAGVALYTKRKPLNVKKGLGISTHDSEGRVITAEYEEFYLVGTYVPNAGEGLKTLPKRLKWNEDFHKYLVDLDKLKPVILCGDLNVAHEPQDIFRPESHTKSPGFTQEERDGFTSFLNNGFIDVFRWFYPSLGEAYTYWSFFRNARALNHGWRLDYFVLSERLLPRACDIAIRKEVLGSDHCPVTIFLAL